MITKDEKSRTSELKSSLLFLSLWIL